MTRAFNVSVQEAIARMDQFGRRLERMQVELIWECSPVWQLTAWRIG